MKELIEDMLQEDMEPSCSAWVLPVVLIPKKVGNPRCSADYSKVNVNTITDAYAIITVQKILESISEGGGVFSSLDLNSGYYHMEMEPGVKLLLSFVHRVCSSLKGTAHFKVLIGALS